MEDKELLRRFNLLQDEYYKLLEQKHDLSEDYYKLKDKLKQEDEYVHCPNCGRVKVDE